MAMYSLSRVCRGQVSDTFQLIVGYFIARYVVHSNYCCNNIIIKYSNYSIGIIIIMTVVYYSWQESFIMKTFVGDNYFHCCMSCHPPYIPPRTIALVLDETLVMVL